MPTCDLNEGISLIIVLVVFFWLNNVTRNQHLSTQKENSTVQIVLPFKDEDTTDLVRKQLKDLSLKTHIDI